METHELMNLARRPRAFEASQRSIWTDPWIGPRLLDAQLDEGTDAASRRKRQREKALAWIEGLLPPRPARILDLGCGPGLYAESLARRGHELHGIDISGAAIEHARRSAREADLAIDYRRGDYLVEELGTGYDLAAMIYCDFGALAPAAGEILLDRLRGALAPGGLFVFDVFGPGLAAAKSPARSWYCCRGPGFWAEKPHLVLEEEFAFPEEKAFASQAIVLAEGGEPALYRTWDRYFDREGLGSLLEGAGYELLEIREDLVEANDFASSEVLFVAARLRAARASAEGRP
jgi:SAM-dependent methyltransferase